MIRATHCLMAASVALAASPAAAAFIRVPSDVPTLSAAVTAATANDIIILERGDHFEATTITIDDEDNLAIVGEDGATLFAGINDSGDPNRNTFVVSADGVRIMNIKFLPRDGADEGRAVVFLNNGDDFTFANNTVGRGNQGFTDVVFCSNGDGARVVHNEAIIVEREGTFQGGGGAVTGLNDCNGLLVADNTFRGPSPRDERQLAVVGVIDFNSAGGSQASDVQVLNNTIRGFDVAISVSSTHCLVEANAVTNTGTGIQIGQDPSEFNDGTDPAQFCVVKRNRLRAGNDGIRVEAGNDNLILENNANGRDIDILLEDGTFDNLVRRNQAPVIVDEGANIVEENNGGDDDDDD